jgi:hypothetical protein
MAGKAVAASLKYAGALQPSDQKKPVAPLDQRK